MFKSLSPFIFLAFIIALSSEYCVAGSPTVPKGIIYITYQEQSFNPLCFVKSFNPEPPETQRPYKPLSTNMPFSVAYSGTSLSATASGTITRLG
jgi:hypothetical protein